jgi:septum site-determining protein MinC
MDSLAIDKALNCGAKAYRLDSNNMEARVFALNFDPELVSIAGFYAVREGFPAAQIGKAMQVRLVGERMRFDPIT